MSPSWRGPHFFVPLLEGVQGEGSDCSGSNPYNNHLRRFTPPPPAEDTLHLDPCPLHHVPLMEGVQGEDSDCSGSNPYNNHLRRFAPPPPNLIT